MVYDELAYNLLDTSVKGIYIKAKESIWIK